MLTVNQKTKFLFLVCSLIGDDFSYAMYLKSFYEDEIIKLQTINEEAILETQKYRQKFKGEVSIFKRK